MTTNTIDEHHERKRAEIFLQRANTVHVKKLTGIFHNGLIVEVHADHFVLLDRVTAKYETILYQELKKPIEMYQEEVRE